MASNDSRNFRSFQLRSCAVRDCCEEELVQTIVKEECVRVGTGKSSRPFSGLVLRVEGLVLRVEG